LKEVIEARASATQVKVDINDPATLQKYQAAQAQLQSAFGRLMAVAEAYPNLKTTEAFQNFQSQIEGTENRINVARRDYNTAVNEYNLNVKTFPNNIFAGLFGFKEKAYYQADAGSEKNPDIKFNIK
jgi:LemA protein